MTEMNESLSGNDTEFETPPTTLITSFLFQCNLFKLVQHNDFNATAICLVCKRQGLVRYVKGKTTSNYHIHMKRLHTNEYEEYLTIKASGVPRIIVSPEEVSHQLDEEFEPAPRTSPLFEHGFFELRHQLPNKVIKANCMTCQRMGRQNLIQARQESSSNLLAHLRRMHLAEYERYKSLISVSPSQPSLSSQADLDIQQSVVSTIKSEDLEFVDVHQDELPGETWDSFESSDYYENVDSQQMHAESAATSTTKTIILQPGDDDRAHGTNKFNDNVDSGSDNDEITEWSDNNRKQLPLLFRSGFFRYLNKDGVTVRAECLNCKLVYCGRAWSSSNFLKHLSRMHPKEYDRFLAMKEEERIGVVQMGQFVRFEQSDFNGIVLNFMISGMHHPSLLEDPSFETLLNDISSQRTAEMPPKKLYHIISPNVLNAEIEERLTVTKDHLHSSLNKLSSVSIAVDAWSVDSKTFMLAIVNWIDPNNFRRVSNVIGCDVFNDQMPNDSLIERLQQIYSEYEIPNKIVATVTNNNRPYEEDERTNQITYIQFEPFDHHIKNPTHLFEKIGIQEVEEALNDEQYAEIHKSAFDKFDALFDQTKSTNLSVKAKSILDGVFNHPPIGSKVSELYNGVSNLVNCDSENLNEISDELEISPFTEANINFLKEYAIILEPIATAIEYLQKNNCYYATLLPMIHSMKDSLIDVKNQGKIQLCQSLLTSILNGVEREFKYLFDFNDERCHPALISTCTHPFFKMRWLKGDLKVHTNQILDLLVRVAKEYDDGMKDKSANSQTSTNEDEEKPAEKKFKFSFDTSSNEEANDETMIQMDFMSFLKKPCQNNENNLDELKQHPWVQKLFIRYNSIVSSAAALERSVPLYDLIQKSRIGQFSDDLFCKMGLLRSSKS